MKGAYISYCNLRDVFGKWINLAMCDHDTLVDQIILEQSLNDLEERTQRWVQQHSPLTCDETLKLAEAFAASKVYYPREKHGPAHPPMVPKEQERW